MPQSLKPWNWQLPEWPDFRFDEIRLRPLESEFLRRSGVHVGAFSHLEPQEQESLKAEMLSDEALLTSKIEGELLDRDSLQSSIRRLFGLTHDARKASPAETGISELQVDVYRNFARPLTDEKLFALHRLVARGRWDLKSVGRYREHEDPMRIVSGAIHDPVVHFEAPPSRQVPHEMKRFIQWFNRPVEPLVGLARAGVAHLYFECIHPFEDGNGRIGRAIAEMALSQAFGQPTLVALSIALEKNRRRYYEELGLASRAIEISRWLEFFGSMVLEAQEQSLRRISFLVEKAKFFERYRGQMNERQAKVLRRMFQEGPDGFKGGLSSNNHIRITGCSPATATRDLAGMVALGALVRTGELKNARYFLK